MSRSSPHYVAEVGKWLIKEPLLQQQLGGMNQGKGPGCETSTQRGRSNGFTTADKDLTTVAVLLSALHWSLMDTEKPGPGKKKEV